MLVLWQRIGWGLQNFSDAVHSDYITPTGEIQQRIWEKTREFVDIEYEYKKDKFAEFTEFKKQMQVDAALADMDFESRVFDKKQEGINIELQNQQAVNDLMMRGAQDFGQILMKGGDDWAEQMFAHLAKMALQHAAMQAGPIGFIGGFLGGFL